MNNQAFVWRIGRFLSRNPLFFLYLAVFLSLAFGMVVYSGTAFLPQLAVFSLSLLFFYFSIKKGTGGSALPGRLISDLLNRIALPASATGILVFLLFGISVFAVVTHFLIIGGIPVFVALQSTDNIEVALIRQAIHEGAPTWLNYASSMTLKGLMPFLLLFLFSKRKMLLFWLFLLLSVFYAIALMQKSFIVLLLFPLLLFLVWNKKLVLAAGVIALQVAGVYFLVMVHNPHLQILDGLQNDPPPKVMRYKNELVPVEEIPLSESVSRMNLGILNRVLLIPGEIAARWFSLVPEFYPFTNGCGYRFLTPLLGCEYADYQSVLYEEIYPHFASQGLKGSVNVASFVVDWANFGYAGLVLSAFLLALWFFVIEQIFQNNLPFLMSINFLQVFILSSSALSTLLLSGGWAVLVFLFLLFRKELIHPAKA